MATLYLSSTYEDLKDYRRVVFEALRKGGHQVTAMEDYVAADQRPVEKCLKDVEKADIYIGLFAFRYGYVPPQQHNNPKGCSITELEFRRAEVLSKPCLTFVVKDTTPWSRAYDDAYASKDKGERIKALRQYVDPLLVGSPPGCGRRAYRSNMPYPLFRLGCTLCQCLNRKWKMFLEDPYAKSPSTDLRSGVMK